MGRHRTALPASVSRARVRVERWRTQRVRGTPMPEALWAEAVRLAETHGLYRVARAVGVDYGALQKRVARHGGTETGETERACRFVEIAPRDGVGGRELPGAVVELAEADGATLVVRLGGHEGLDVLALVEAFRRGRP